MVEVFCDLIALVPGDGPNRSPPTPVAPAASLPSVKTLAFGNDSTLQWNVCTATGAPSRGASNQGWSRDGLTPVFVNGIMERTVSGSVTQNRRLVVVLPVETFNTEKEATLGVTRGIKWWERNQPVFRNLVNRCKTPVTILYGSIMGRMITVNI